MNLRYFWLPSLIRNSLKHLLYFLDSKTHKFKCLHNCCRSLLCFPGKYFLFMPILVLNMQKVMISKMAPSFWRSRHLVMTDIKSSLKIGTRVKNHDIKCHNKLRMDIYGERRVYFLLDSQELQCGEKFKITDKVRFHHAKSSNHMKHRHILRFPCNGLSLNTVSPTTCLIF